MQLKSCVRFNAFFPAVINMPLRYVLSERQELTLFLLSQKLCFLVGSQKLSRKKLPITEILFKGLPFM